MCMCRVTLVSESWHIHELNGLARMLCSSQHTHTHTCTILQQKCVEEAGKHTTRLHKHEAPSRTHARALVRARSLSLSLVLVGCLSYIRTYALSLDPISVARARSLSACVCVRLSRPLALAPPPHFLSLSHTLSFEGALSLPPSPSPFLFLFSPFHSPSSSTKTNRLSVHPYAAISWEALLPTTPVHTGRERERETRSAELLVAGTIQVMVLLVVTRSMESWRGKGAEGVGGEKIVRSR